MKSAIFLFLYFSISFFIKNIFLFSKFTGIYPGRPAAGRPAPGRLAAGRQGLFCKSFYEKFTNGPLEDRPLGSRAAGPGRPARHGERNCSTARSRQRGCAGRQDCRARPAPPAAEEDRTCRCCTGAEAEGHDHRPPPRYELIFIFNFYFPRSRIQFLFQ